MLPIGGSAIWYYMTFVWSYCKNLTLRLLEQLEKLEIQKTDKHENKVKKKKIVYILFGPFLMRNPSQTIALGTSKLNYLDPRISVQWCKTHEVPIEKVSRSELFFFFKYFVTQFFRFTRRPTGRSSDGQLTWSWTTTKFSTFRSAPLAPELKQPGFFGNFPIFTIEWIL